MQSSHASACRRKIPFRIKHSVDLDEWHERCLEAPAAIECIGVSDRGSGNAINAMPQPNDGRTFNMIKDRSLCALAAAAAAMLASQSASAIEMQAGDWNFSVNGNVNVHYINSQCDKNPETVLTVGGACTGGGASQDSVSSVSNGLLPAAITFGAATTQKGYDIAAHFGFYPGISTNDGGSPNLQQGTTLGPNTALGTTGLDVRQVYMTFGNTRIGTFTLGRNFGLFGFDAIINDMTIPGVGVAGAMATATPANTSLGSIGFGYIYCDTLAQMNYTTPTMGGLALTLGIFDPVEPLLQGAPTPEATPGFHGKLTFTSGGLYLSASFLAQKQEGATNAQDYDSSAIDIGGKYKLGGAEMMAYFYSAKGVGTTALFTLGDDGAGNARDSDGFIAQITYALGDTKLGLNYGQSNLDFANSADESANPTLLEKNSKVTLGVYHSLTPNLMLLAEYSDISTEAHNGNENSSSNFNVGAFLSF
jgi:predicted porin